MRFKVGDIIEERKSYYDYLPNGRITKAEVISVCELSSHCILELRIRVLEHADKENIGKTLRVFPGYFDLVERKNETIVIYRKGNEVVALDKSTGKKATAKCSPEDEFDFYTGAKIAFGRLTEEPKLLNTKICITKTNSPHLTVGRIYEIKNGKFAGDCGHLIPITDPFVDKEDLELYLSGKDRKNERIGCFTKTKFVEVVE